MIELMFAALRGFLVLSITNCGNVYPLLFAVYYSCLYFGGKNCSSLSHRSLQILSKHFHNIGMEGTIFAFLTKYQCMTKVHLKLPILESRLKLKDKHWLPMLPVKYLVFYILKKKNSNTFYKF